MSAVGEDTTQTQAQQIMNEEQRVTHNDCIQAHIQRLPTANLKRM